jgi:hypothetical protein
MSNKTTNNEKSDQKKDRRSIAKNIVLVSWIITLGFLSTLALGGGFSSLFDYFSRVTSKRSQVDFGEKYSLLVCQELSTSYNNIDKQTRQLKVIENIPNDQKNKKILWKKGEVILPLDLLTCYIVEKYQKKYREEVPPIGLVLDSLQSNYSWRDAKLNNKLNSNEAYKNSFNAPKNNLTEDQFLNGNDYHMMFQIVDENLQSMAEDTNLNSDQLQVSNEILPSTFRFSGTDFKTLQIRLPRGVTSWIVWKRNREAQLHLVDTFFIVIMLGALGSVIFLMSEHIAPNPTNDISLYFYRPLFGALLAVSSFIISISASGIISEQGDTKNINIRAH